MKTRGLVMNHTRWPARWCASGDRLRPCVTGDSLTAGPKILRFGVFELDMRSNEMRKQGVRIRVQSQPLKVLGLLLERPGEVVTREELHNRLWPDKTYVDFEHGLNSALTRLRQALSDSADTP